MYKLYSMRRSGNCYKVRLALAQLDIPHELVEIDILQGETRTPEFLKMNPERPRAALGGGARPLHRRIERHPVVRRRPHAAFTEDRADRAEMLQWMFFEQHSLEPNLGAAYFWLALVKGGRELQQHALEDWMQEGYRALGVMEKHLATRRFFVADRYSIADIALYAYTHLAHQCDYDLAGFPAVRRWLDRVAGAAQSRRHGLAAGPGDGRGAVETRIDFEVRHGRACPGHPDSCGKAMPRELDARHKAGHDGGETVPQSAALIFASLITFAHLAMSALMIAAKASGESLVTSRPSCASLAFISGSVAILAAC